MNKNIWFLAIIVTLISASFSCNKEAILDNRDYLVFGHFYGQCVGESCIEIFKLTENKLLEDQKKAYPNQGEQYNGDYTELGSDQYELAKDLFDFVPNQLLEENSKVFGCPDCADGGGLYVEIRDGSDRKYWYIDQNTNNIPEYLHEFVKEVNERIRLLNE